jgi:hypothetical protein
MTGAPHSVTCSITREELDTLVPPRGLALDRKKSADLFPIVWRNVRALAKDFSKRGGVWRWLGPIVVRRELRALEALRDRAPVPRVLSVVDRYAYVMEQVEGEPCNHLDAATVGPGFFAAVADAIDRLHAAGWVHCDLKSFGNLIRGPGDHITIVDLATAFPRSGPLGPLRGWWFKRMAEIDRLALAKLKGSLRPELLTDKERRALDHPPALVRLARVWRRLYRRARSR